MDPVTGGLILGGLGALMQGIGVMTAPDQEEIRRDDREFQRLENEKQRAFERGEREAAQRYQTQMTALQQKWAVKAANYQAEQAAKTREAQKAYLESNLGDFTAPDYQFDPSKHSDILDPLREKQAETERGQAQRMALKGGGDLSGVERELQNRLSRQHAGDYARTITGLAREGEEQAYNRALQEYKMRQANVMAQAPYQGAPFDPMDIDPFNDISRIGGSPLGAPADFDMKDYLKKISRPSMKAYLDRTSPGRR